MPHAHQRAYRLLSERVRLGTTARRALYVTLAALTGSGIAWLCVHFGAGASAPDSDSLRRLAQESLALKIHGATAFAALFALGAMSVHHVRLAWAVKRNRMIGSALVALFSLLTVSGYALYYLVNDDTHAIISWLHWGLGLALVPLLIVHIAVGRRSRPALA
jgi:hypothetical protein